MKRLENLLSRKTLSVLAIFLITLCFTATRGQGTGTPFSSTHASQGQNEAAPIPDIKAYGQDGPVSISSSDSLSVVISLNAGGNTSNADWWVVVMKPDGNWYYYDLSTQIFQSGLTATYQGALFDLSSYQVLNTSGLSQGAYTYYLGWT